jgi:hypothetical protein
MKRNNPPYICDYVNFCINKRTDIDIDSFPYNYYPDKDYIMGINPPGSGGPGLSAVFSVEELKGLADFIYNTIGEK